MTKPELRRAFLAKRRALTLDEVRHRSQQIASLFFTYFAESGLVRKDGCMHTFLPIQRHNEVDTWCIINGLWAGSYPHCISVPVIDPATRLMAHYTLTPDTPLVENNLGIPEPSPDNRQKTDLGNVLAVLVPLLAFDEQGHRVGYGGGYYDRFLAQQVPHSLKIGLSLFEPVHKIEPVEQTDVRLDACITPAGICRFV